MKTLAILGRPNVGKSTLFNRLTGSRRALVHDMPGMTRDRIEGDGRLGELEFKLIDTAGLEHGEEASLQGRLRAQSMAGLEQADVGLFLIDARAGLTALDREIASWLRRGERPILLLANKAEGHRVQQAVVEAWELGLGEPIAVSAEHGDGLPDLLEALRPHLAAAAQDAADAGSADEPAEEDRAEGDAAEEGGAEGEQTRFRMAVVGRPNVGKSTLVNRLLQSDRLLTGPEPGLTRDSVTVSWEWQDRRVDLVDTAGLRRKPRVQGGAERIAASASVRAIREAHVVVLMIDAQNPLEHQDLTIAGLAVEKGRALVLVINKVDLVEDRQALLAEIRARVGDQLSQVAGLDCISISARSGRGVDKLLPAVVAAFERWNTRVSTGQLNRWLHEALDRHPPPMAQNRRIKIRYATQASTRPPTFVLFANKPADMLPGSYTRYLASSLRNTFKLGGVPLRLRFRHGDNPYD